MNDETATVTVDVRDDLAHGREPFSKIMQAIKALATDQSLKLISPFEPLPLFVVLGKLGFKHRSSQVGRDHWETLFAKNLPEITSAPSAAPRPHSPDVSSEKKEECFVDARGLEPPQPLVKILTELEALGSRGKLRAHTDRRPMHLLDAVKERGYAAVSEEQSDGSWITTIVPT